jgi:hypothetical protein
MTAPLKWETRNRGSYRWTKLASKPESWYLQMEYRSIDSSGKETWRSPHVNGYNEKA